MIPIPFAANQNSFFFNKILYLPDTVISILALLLLGMSIATIYLLAKVSIQEKQLRILKREKTLLKFKSLIR